MAARLIRDQGRLFIEADLSDFHAAGLFLAFRSAHRPVRMGHTSQDDAQRLANHINAQARAKADAEAARAYADYLERSGR